MAGRNAGCFYGKVIFLHLEELQQYCADVSGYEIQEVKAVTACFLEKITEELSQGNHVDLSDDFGAFSVRLRTSHLADNSPRVPKGDHYKVIFREGKGMKRRLKGPVRKKNPFP